MRSAAGRSASAASWPCVGQFPEGRLLVHGRTPARILLQSSCIIRRGENAHVKG